MNQEQIEQRIKATFTDCDLAVFDLTGSGNHFEVRIASDHFKGLSRIRQHQAVMAVFKSELESGELHALSLKTLTKTEN